MTDGPRLNTDGRVARGERTRAAILEAHRHLVRSGVLKPTGKLIAEQAGVSLRTVWLTFKDLEALLAASTVYWLDADAELRRGIDAGLPLARRIEEYVDQRVRRLEHIAPAARSAALGEPFSPALRASRAAHVQRSKDDLASAFAPELAGAGDSSGPVVAALFVATSWPTWSTLRDDLGLSAEEAAVVLRRSLSGLLGP